MDYQSGYLVEYPCQWQGYGYTSEECRPVAPLAGYIVEYEMQMDEIAFQGERPDPRYGCVYLAGRAAEYAVEDEDGCYGQRDIEHALYEKRELPVTHLLKEYARHQRHDKHEQYHPDAGSVYRPLLADSLTHIDAYEEDWHAAPEYLQMAYRLMYRGDPLHEYAPHNHHYRQPPVDRMPAYELHVWGSCHIQHHDSRDIPEGELIVKPEVPVEAYLHNQVEPCAGATAMKPRNVVETGYYEPGRIYAQETAQIEMTVGWRLAPREPQADAAQKEKHVDTDVSHAPEPEESIPSGKVDMEHYNHQHGGSHQGAPETADVGKFDVGYSHFLYFFTHQAKQMLAIT